MLENLEQSVRRIQMGKSRPLERTELANQIQGLRILDHWDASEKNKNMYSNAFWVAMYCTELKGKQMAEL